MKKYLLIQGSIIRNGGISEFEKYLKLNLSIISDDIQIIVSTWDVDDVLKKYLIYNYPSVKFIFTRDPGALIKTIDETLVTCNVNRLIASTVQGLNEIPGDALVFKIRTDSYISNLDAFSLAENFYSQNFKRSQQFAIFDDFILNANLFIRNPNSHMPLLYHPGDIALIGYASDLNKLFNIAHATTDIYKKISSSKLRTNYALVPEQYIFLSSIRKNLYRHNIKPTFKENFIFSNSEKIISDQYLINNFIFLSSKTLGFCWPKYGKKYFYKGWSSIYDLNDWKYLQNKYNSANFKVKFLRIGIKKIMSNFASVYYRIRNFLLKNKLIYKIAYFLFAKR